MLRWALLFSLALLPTYASAKLACPKSIAILAGSRVASEGVVPKVRQAYAELGCTTRFVELPGRRGIKAFNDGEVDGELFRLPWVETRYFRPFVRSDVAITRLVKARWGHKDEVVRDARPVGFLLGAIWHERFASHHDGIGYVDMDQMFEAYGRGDIGSFFATRWSVDHHGFDQVPVFVSLVSQDPTYHYLDAKFQPLMQALSDRLAPLMPTH